MNVKHFFLLLFCLGAIGACSDSNDTSDVPEVPKEKDVKTIIERLVNNMKKVHGGSFTMGADKKDVDAFENEKPAHTVNLTDFYINAYEVTQEEWEAIMGTNPSQVKGPKYPVTNVSYNDCLLFISKLNELSGKIFSLPTEAQWEFSALGGELFRYAGADEIANVAWYKENSDNVTHEVGKKVKNGYDLFDMSGNVAEICSDFIAIYENGTYDNPKGPEIGTNRVVRGGSFLSTFVHCRNTFRGEIESNAKENNVGFRLALNGLMGLQLSHNEIYIPKEGGEAVITIAADGKDWNYSCESTWCTLEKKGNTLAIQAKENKESLLSAEVKIFSGDFEQILTIYQKGSGLTIVYNGGDLIPNPIKVPWDGGTADFSVLVDQEGRIDMYQKERPNWVSATVNSQLNFALNIYQNESTEPREARVEVVFVISETETLTGYIYLLQDGNPQAGDPPAYVKNPEEVINNLVKNMIAISGGTFSMGDRSGDDEYAEFARPVHDVTVSNFEIGKYEVTLEEWIAVMETNPIKGVGEESYKKPINNISWNDCQQFIQKLNEKTKADKKFKLPTEAQWEYAARANQDYILSGSDIPANVAHCNAEKEQNKGMIQIVGSKQPNQFGLYDMSGNVREFCSDWNGKYNSDAQTDPTGPIGPEESDKGGKIENKIRRGGCVSDYANCCTVYRRESQHIDYRDSYTGFRIAR